MKAEWPPPARGRPSPRPSSAGLEVAVGGVEVYARVLPAVPRSVRRIRKELDSALERLRIDSARRRDIALVVSEAGSNVARHAYAGTTPGPLEVRAALRRRSLLLTVADAGRGMPARSDGAGLGIGLVVMRRLCDELQVAPALDGSGTLVSAAFHHATPALRTRARATQLNRAVRVRDDAAVLRDYADILRAASAGLHGDAHAVVAQAARALAHAERIHRAAAQQRGG